MGAIEETDLAGIGTRYLIRTRSGENLIIVVHDAGPVEIYHATGNDPEPAPVAHLNEEEARHLAAIIGRTIYRPEAIERLSRSGVRIVWHELQPGAFAIGKTPDELQVPEKTGGTIISVVQRGGERNMDVSGDYVFQEGDQAAVAGSQKETQASIRLLDKGQD
ncbi:MAG: TrkA C-terminal domain-containing protein [Dehalococcoidia bacterium]